MKHKFLTLVSLFPLALTSCANASRVSFNKLKEHVEQIIEENKHPYYRVQGVLDFNNSVTIVDANFNRNPTGDTFTPYVRYTEGFYLDSAGDSQVLDERDVLIHGMASHSYWLRAPIKINKDNFYGFEKDYSGDTPVDTKTFNQTSAFAQLQLVIASWLGKEGNANPSSTKLYYEVHKDGSFAIGGEGVHTKFLIDNYPYYPDPEENPILFKDYDGEWSEYDPFPAYKNEVDIKGDVRFEYDKDGWLKREYAKTLDYNYSATTAKQLYLEAVYTYQFE